MLDQTLDKQITTQEEVDSIMSPDYLRIVGQVSEENLHTLGDSNEALTHHEYESPR